MHEHASEAELVARHAKVLRVMIECRVPTRRTSGSGASYESPCEQEMSSARFAAHLRLAHGMDVCSCGTPANHNLLDSQVAIQRGYPTGYLIAKNEPSEPAYEGGR
jgi:hypothetical protein